MPAAELHAASLIEEAENDDGATPTQSDDLDLSTSKSNVNIYDQQSNQKMTMTEIEALKQDDMRSAKDMIERIMQSHSSLDQKTAFSLAKYTLRKHKKYMKRFTVLPLDVATLTDWMMVDKDFSKVMELRNETIGLIGCWANVKSGGNVLPVIYPQSRYLVVDDTGGLLTAAIAERIGILHHNSSYQNPASNAADSEQDEPHNTSTSSLPHDPNRQPPTAIQTSAATSTITVIHSNQQANLSLLRYFNYDHNNPTPSHPLHTHLHTVSWLQLLDPTSCPSYHAPDLISDTELRHMKSNRRSNYYRKLRRWQRTKRIIDETRLGGFNGLIVASHTDPVSILSHLVPLLAGSSQVVVYAPHIEPLLALSDYYSTARRTAFLGLASDEERRKKNAESDFPVDPTLLLVPHVQSSRVRRWQVLPGRTHPLMTGKGGAEGFVWCATRVVPVQGRVEARGHGKRGKGGGRVVEGDGEVRGGDLKRQKKAEDGVVGGDEVDMEIDVDIQVETV